MTSEVSGDAVIQQWIVLMAAAVAGTATPPCPTVAAAVTVGTTSTIPSSSPAAATVGLRRLLQSCPLLPLRLQLQMQ